MAKIVKHPLIASYQAMKKINQLLKDYVSLYVIDSGGAIYLKYSGALGIEKVGLIHSDYMEKILPYTNIMIASAKFAEFTKNARITSTEYRHGPYQVTTVVDTPKQEIDYLEDVAHDVTYPIIPYLIDNHPYSFKEISELSFYSKCFHEIDPFDLMKKTMHAIVPTTTIDDGIVTLKQNGVITIEDDVIPASPITKELFPAINKMNHLSFHGFSKDDTTARVAFREEYEMMDIYTFAGFLLY